MPHGAVITFADGDESIRKATKRLIASVRLTVEDFPSAEDFARFARPLFQFQISLFRIREK